MYVYEVGCTTETADALRKLQKHLQPRLKGRARPVKHLHCTVWFHGDFVRLLASLRKAGQTFSYDTAKEAYERSLRMFTPGSDFTSVVVPANLALMGHKNGVLVLDLEANQELTERHLASKRKFLETLDELGVQDAGADAAWAWAMRPYRPHISLFKDVTSALPPKIIPPKQLTLHGLSMMKHGKSAVPRKVVLS